ncbi:MAG: ArsR/SmtB family transcription factor [Saprospiraceae bacterium]
MGKQKAEASDTTQQRNPLDYAAVRKAALVLRALNHKLRQRIVDILHENKTLTVTQIYVQLRIEQSVASQHLAILRASGAVVTERQGKYIIYALDYDRLRAIQEYCNALDGLKN